LIFLKVQLVPKSTLFVFLFGSFLQSKKEIKLKRTKINYVNFEIGFLRNQVFPFLQNKKRKEPSTTF